MPARSRLPVRWTMAIHPITTEHIESLVPDELSALEPIFRKLGHVAAAEQCAALLASEPTEEILARRIAGLPAVSSVQGAQERCQLQKDPVSSFSSLWKIFVVCGFSSRMDSNPEKPLDRLRKSDSTLLSLDSVLQRGGRREWIGREIDRASESCGNAIGRDRERRTEMIVVGRTLFGKARSASSDRLDDGALTNSTLDTFIRVARGKDSDVDLGSSESFSRKLTPRAGKDFTKFYLIGPKQLRNMLVNSGLGRNVLPLDSRWLRFLGYIDGRKKPNLNNDRVYCDCEDLVRRALLKAQAARPDIVNLAILDSLVFDQGAATKQKEDERINMPAAKAKPRGKPRP